MARQNAHGTFYPLAGMILRACLVRLLVHRLSGAKELIQAKRLNLQAGMGSCARETGADFPSF